MGVWLDWMAQGAQLKNNLLHDNSLDIFLEVNHGPLIISNNILLSKKSLLMNSSGAAFVHNLFSGEIDVISYDSRLTPVMKPHSTYVALLHDNPGGDIQFINNLFVNGSNTAQYNKALLPVIFQGNVYTKGATRTADIANEQKFGEMNQKAKEQLQKYRDYEAVERDAVVDNDFDASVNLIKRDESIYLDIVLKKDWLNQKRRLVTQKTLTKAIVPRLPFENVNGSPVNINIDYFGRKRSLSNPSPGPFEFSIGGKQRLKLWEEK
jgi:alpha-L-arabinofuranosidase